MKKYQTEILKIKQETPLVKTFLLKVDPDFTFLAGQYVFVFYKERKRPYSIASSPLVKGTIELSVKLIQNGHISKYFHEDVKVGDSVIISEAKGHFVLDDSKNITMIAGGCGIIPFRSMIKYCIDMKVKRKITLVYSSRTHFLYKEELNNMGITVLYTDTGEDNLTCHKGRIDKNYILENVKNIKNQTFYICGPHEFTQDIYNILQDIGINRIKIDVWG
jgi:ferredoxin-NADP reductase